MKQHHIYLALLAAFLAIGAASVGPWAPSPFTSRTGTNTTAAAWRTALGASGTSGGSLTNTALVGGSATGLTNTDLTASRVVVSSASKVLASSTVTSTTLGYLDATSSIQNQLDGKPTVALTNVALLSGTNVFTGTNTLNMASLKASGVVSFVLLATNLAWVGNVTGSASTPSPWSNAAQVATFTMPPVIGDNGFVRVTLSRVLTNSVAAAVYPVFYGGSGDGFLGAGGATGTSAVTNYTAAQVVFAANGSATNQIVNAGGAQNATWTTSSSVVDTSTNWTLKVGLSHSSGAGVTSTNVGLRTLIVEWVFGP